MEEEAEGDTIHAAGESAGEFFLPHFCCILGLFSAAACNRKSLALVAKAFIMSGYLTPIAAGGGCT